jgi:hypothetical protein
MLYLDAICAAYVGYYVVSYGTRRLNYDLRLLPVLYPQLRTILPFIPAGLWILLYYGARS